MRKFLALFCLIIPRLVDAQSLLTPFEKSNGHESATYFECIDFYKKLDAASPKIAIKEMGMSDAGYPYHLILYSNEGHFDPREWHRQHKLVILVINGIHPGEPDGIDASMMLMRDLQQGRISIPNNIAIALIPVYNIGGALNRNSYSRVNQDGPDRYGFRGNSQNLDLNRDFTKCDSRDARSFTKIFHWLNPDLQLDTHVSDGADYQHTMTLITSQWNKLGGKLGQFTHDVFDPALYEKMATGGWAMCPYVNFEQGNTEQGWEAFTDFPRYSSGYAALFHCLAYISETHMLKPFHDRVLSTYALMQNLIRTGSAHAEQILACRKQDEAADLAQTEMPLSWTCDSSRCDSILFKGYTAAQKPSEVSGAPRLYYDHSKPFEKKVPYYDIFKAGKPVQVPEAYLIPRGWHEVIDLLKQNGVQMKSFSKDTQIFIQAYHIDQYKPLSRPYEKHHKNQDTRVSPMNQTQLFLKGDYIISTHQPARRFLVEMLEPTGDDSYFSWNFFDAILQQKEGYSDYRWEDVAAGFLKEHPEVRTALDEKKKADPRFAANPQAQLEFVYKQSPYYESAHLRYPVYRLLASVRSERIK